MSPGRDLEDCLETKPLLLQRRKWRAERGRDLANDVD